MTLPAAVLEPIIALLLPQLEALVIEQAGKLLKEALENIGWPAMGGPGLAPMKPGFTSSMALAALKERQGRPRVVFEPPARMISATSPRYVDPKPKKKTTPALREARVLQGKYLGTLRRLQGPDRKRVKDMKDARGYRAAFALANKLAPRGK